MLVDINIMRLTYMALYYDGSYIKRGHNIIAGSYSEAYDIGIIRANKRGVELDYIELIY